MGQFKAGAYILGDLCYVLTDKQWSEVCNAMEEQGEEQYKPHTGKPHTLSDGTIYGILGTQNGDGCYDSNWGAEYGVDSGTLGCVLVTDSTLQLLPDAWESLRGGLVNLVTYKKPFDIIRHGNGDLEFGKVTIVTGYADEDEEDEGLLAELTRTE